MHVQVMGGFTPIMCSHREVSRQVVSPRFSIYILYINEQELPIIISLNKPQMIANMVFLQYSIIHT